MTWTVEAEAYRTDVATDRSAYHRGRLDTAHRLLAKVPLLNDARILDYGCGEGTFMAELDRQAEGMDPDPEMVKLARARGLDIRRGREIRGSYDLIIALNVLAYMTRKQHDAFWESARDSEWVLLSHSNSLFDLYAFNTRPGPYTIRANPLHYPEELKRYGFSERAQAFFNYHPDPPSKLGHGDEGHIFDPDEIDKINPSERKFKCSTYFSLAQRNR